MAESLFPIKTTWPPPDKSLDFYIIIAWWAPGGWWKIFSEQWGSQESAEAANNKLPKGYTERKIFHLKG